MEFLLAVFLSFVPALLYAGIVYWIDRYEKEPIVLLGLVFFWGAAVATFGAIVSQSVLEGATFQVTGSETAVEVAGASIFAPLTEESLKGFAVLLVFLVLRREFDSLLDGLVYAGVVALGFAATENVLYLWSASEESGLEGLFSLFFLRVILGAWDHPFYTSFIGIGLAVSRLSRVTWARWLAPPAGWAVAVFTHSLHNSLATAASSASAFGLLMFLLDWAGWVLISVVLVAAVLREGRLLATHLAEEVEHGALNADQYRTATSSWSQTFVRVRAAAGGRFGATSRFYHLCGELAHKKHLLATCGDEGCNARLVEELREEMKKLSPHAFA